MKFLNVFVIASILAVTLCAINIHAAETDPAPDDQYQSSKNKKIDVSISTGVHSFPEIGMFGVLPLPVSVAVSVDVNRLRLKMDVGYHLNGIFHSTASGGFLWIPAGKQAAHQGGFQLKVPLMIEAGFLMGDVEAHDGYSDGVKWLVAGPGVGVDFVWWKADGLGFNISIDASYLFRADIGSEINEGYSYIEDAIGTLDMSVMLGISI